MWLLLTREVSLRACLGEPHQVLELQIVIEFGRLLGGEAAQFFPAQQVGNTVPRGRPLRVGLVT
jgi:hypothetical protein